jgi:hypothetical protein
VARRRGAFWIGRYAWSCECSARHWRTGFIGFLSRSIAPHFGHGSVQNPRLVTIAPGAVARFVDGSVCASGVAHVCIGKILRNRS